MKIISAFTKLKKRDDKAPNPANLDTQNKIEKYFIKLVT